jgi:hypothetical protein
LPPELHDAASQRESSLLLVLALAIAPDPARQAPQWQLLSQQLGADRTAHCRRLHESLASLDRRLYLPLVEIALPALRRRPGEELSYLRGLIERVTQAGGEPRLFDHLLLRLLDAYLTELPQLGGQIGDRRGKLSPARAAHALLAVVAAHGHRTAETAHAAFAAGCAQLDEREATLAQRDFEPLARLRDTALLDRALERLRVLPPAGKRTILAAAWAAIRHDETVEIEELELLRVIAAVLGAPLPPVASMAAAVV